MPKATQVRAEPTPPKTWTCAQCGKTGIEKPYGFASFKDKALCSRACDHAYQRTPYLERPR